MLTEFVIDSMVKKLAENKKLALVITAIIVIQCAVLVYWQEQRGNYFVDELFSFGYASSFSAESSHYIMEDESWKYDSWMDSEDLISQLEVDDDNSLLSLPVDKQISLLASKRTFMGLLNIIMSFTEPFEGYSKGALLLNIIILLISELLLGKIIFILTRSKQIMVLSLIMYGFSAFIIGMCEFIRFYLFVIMLLLLVLFCHLKLWKCNKIWMFLIIELIAFISAYYGLKHSELVLVLCGSFFCFFFISLLCRRQLRNAIVYATPLLLGTYFYVYKKTLLFDVILHPSHFADANNYGLGTTAYYFTTMTSERVGESLGIIKECISGKWFGSGFIALAFLGLFIAWIIMVIIERSKAIPKPKEPNHYIGFIIIVVLTIITYMTFMVLSYLHLDRYLSFAVVLMMIVFWFCIGLLQRECPNRTMLAAFAIVVIASGILCQQADHYPYLEIGDRNGLVVAKNYQAIDSVIVENYANGVEEHAVYDCVVNSGRDVRILATSFDRQYAFDSKDLPEQFLVWCHASGGADKMYALLYGTGYTAEKIGETHINEIYLCCRKH